MKSSQHAHHLPRAQKVPTDQKIRLVAVDYNLKQNTWIFWRWRNCIFSKLFNAWFLALTERLTPFLTMCRCCPGAGGHGGCQPMEDFQAVFSAQAAEASYLMQRWLSWGSWNICSCPFSLDWVMLLCFLQLQSHYDSSRDGAVVAAQSPLSQQVAQGTSPRLATVLLKSFS